MQMMSWCHPMMHLYWMKSMWTVKVKNTKRMMIMMHEVIRYGYVL